MAAVQVASAIMPQAWSNVRAWASAEGLGSPSRLLGLLQQASDDEARGRPLADARARSLIRFLSQGAFLSRVDEPAAPIGQIAAVYGPFLGWIDAASRSSGNTSSWLAPLVDPRGASTSRDAGAAAAKAMWPATPLGVLVSAEQTVRDLLHYPPADPAPRLIDIYETAAPNAGPATADSIVEAVQTGLLGVVDDARTMGDLLGAMRVPREPVLTGPLTAEAYRRQWPGLVPSLTNAQAPFVIVTARGATPDQPDYAAVAQNGRIIASVGDGDAAAAQQERQRREGVYPFNPDTTDTESAGLPSMPQTPEPWEQLLYDVVASVRQGRPDLVGLASVAIAPAETVLGSIGAAPRAASGVVDALPPDGATASPYYAGAFDPADVLAAVEARVPDYATDRILDAVAGDPADQAAAARAYTGAVGTSETTPEFDAFVAPYVAARGCAADATQRDRARLARAARVLGVDPRQFTSRAPLCAELAEAVVARRAGPA
ncbi:hypothetical protein pneo_cds_557 [Pandoravirus neocaledonia]|uniref:Uncharacterized protein n=1 Tax=Pandoravirus neocaledonia TaxID=2107708 RepID=A0A2U7UCI7_9VIRU|nr:hypothetical protein pneo_cds_557 [Pandoravirus neocaledonia]AVK76164.1 hypothetical protein pneo_cds_557 [Pandoravirus neocaledonia]